MQWHRLIKPIILSSNSFNHRFLLIARVKRAMSIVGIQYFVRCIRWKVPFEQQRRSLVCMSRCLEQRVRNSETYMLKSDVWFYLFPLQGSLTVQCSCVLPHLNSMNEDLLITHCLPVSLLSCLNPPCITPSTSSPRKDAVWSLWQEVFRRGAAGAGEILPHTVLQMQQ